MLSKKEPVKKRSKCSIYKVEFTYFNAPSVLHVHAADMIEAIRWVMDEYGAAHIKVISLFMEGVWA